NRSAGSWKTLGDLLNELRFVPQPLASKQPPELRTEPDDLAVLIFTSGTWVRGILASDYGVDIDKVEWITFEDPHIAEYRDPEFVKRASPGKELVQMLLDGE